MSGRLANTAAVVGAAAVLLLVAWFDTSVLADAQRQSAATFDPSGLVTLLSVASVVVAGGCLAVGWLGSRATPLVGLLYAVVGGSLALLPWLAFGPGAQVNDRPALLPEPLAQAIGEIWSRTQGPFNAVGIVGGAMLVAGLVAVIAPLRRRDRSGASALAAQGDAP